MAKEYDLRKVVKALLTIAAIGTGQPPRFEGIDELSDTDAIKLVQGIVNLNAEITRSAPIDTSRIFGPSL